MLWGSLFRIFLCVGRASSGCCPYCLRGGSGGLISAHLECATFIAFCGTNLRELRKHFFNCSQMFQNNIADQQFDLKVLIKNIEKIFLDLKKMNELTKLLLCDLILNFSHPMETEDLVKVEENNIISKEFKISDHLVPSLNDNI